MTRLFTNQPITPHLDSKGNLTAFTWGEQRHLLARIVQHWEVNTDWWTASPAHREYFAAITTRGMLCVVYEDKLKGGWWVEKVYD